MRRRGAVGYCKLEKASWPEQTSQLESEGKRKQAWGGWFQEEDLAQKPWGWSVQHAWHILETARKPVWLEECKQGEKCEEVTSDGSWVQSQRAL